MLTAGRLRAIASEYARLRLAVLGDFCLDRYLEIDPARQETSIETSLPVHNIVRVRASPGGAGTIVNNLAALGVGTIHAVGFRGDDGEGFELARALAALPGVRLDSLLTTSERRTFTYTKPIVAEPGQSPRELERLDFKNWTPTPPSVEKRLIEHLRALAPQVDAMILLDQVDVAETGAITSGLLRAVAELAAERPSLWILADGRRGLSNFPAVCFKMNQAELRQMLGDELDVEAIRSHSIELARQRGRHVFVTLGADGMMAASPDGRIEQVPALPLRGAIDIVGAGDCVTANLTAALSAGASLPEALTLAMTAASVVVHKLGTTGTASVEEIAALLPIGA